jgi:hypothetical protein
LKNKSLINNKKQNRMKKFKFRTLAAIVVYAMLAVVFTSCDDAGVTSKTLNGDEQNLPDELKGLKIYNVSTGGVGYVKVAVLDGKINSTTYQVGKVTESTVIVNRQNSKLIEVSQILVENDSIIVCRK